MDGDSFYEKTAPSHTPDWVHRCTVLSEDAKEGRIDYLTIDDLSMLLFVANLGCDRDAPAALAVRRHGAPRLPVLRSRPVPALHLRGRARRRAPREGGARPARPDRLPEDERRDRACRSTSRSRRDGGPTRGTGVRRRVRADDRPRRPRPRDDGLADRRPHRQGLHRPQHEPAGREHRGRLFAATRAARAGLDAAHVGRGRGRRLRAAGLPDRQRLGTLRRGRRPVGAVREGPYNDLAPAMEALGVEPEEDPSGPLPRTASSAVAAKSSDEIALASKDPALFEYVRRREFGGGNDGAGPGRGRRHRQLVRDPQAPGHAAALRRPARARRRAALVGRPQGPPDHQGRQAPGGPHRGPPARVREVRGHHPRRPLRSRRGAHLRRRVVRTGGVDRHEGLVPAPRSAVPEPRVPLRQDTDGLARVPRERADRAADRLAAFVPPDARRGRPPGLRRRRLVVRAEARRDPMSRRALDGRDGAALAHGTGRHRHVPRAPHDPRADR